MKKILKRVISLAVSVAVTSSMSLGGCKKVKAYENPDNEHELPELILQYDEPAIDWETQALPIGNGSIGAMVFGGVETEKLQINESSIWSGGPGANSSYKGGDNNYSASEVHNALNFCRQKIQEMSENFAKNNAAHLVDGRIVASNYPDLYENGTIKSNLDKLKGVKNGFGTYQTLGNINIIDRSGQTGYSQYRRTSNISKAVQTVEYTVNGVDYKREYFISNPAGVLIAKLTASEKGKLSKSISIDSEQGRKTISVNASEGKITMTGQPSDHGVNGLKFAQQLKVINIGGTLSGENSSAIRVNGADSIIIIMSAGTNYKSDSSTSYNYFDNRNPLDNVEEKVDKAAERDYDELYEEHVKDYKNLFDRWQIDFGAYEIPSKMTDDLLAGYGKNNSAEDDRYLETLFAQYGRFLLIECSREDSKLPANLQGLWAQGLSPMWNSDYHTNINLQMNYWLAEQTNLRECHDVVVRYIADMVEKGTLTAKKYYCKQDGSEVRGWVIHHENNIWGNTAPSDWTTAFYFPAAAAWQCFDIWDIYSFNDDKEYLKKYFDIMISAALFWVDNLWTDSRDGKLVANPSYSPEHGVFSMGCTSDQAIIWELFEQIKKGAEVLGLSDDSRVKEIAETQKKLYMPSLKDPTLGGQYREWKDETILEINNSDMHRHQNHLYVLHPGTYIVAGRSEEDDLMMEAARKTLDKRGDDGTGWSKAWKINMWARLRNGNRAHKLLKEQISGSTYNNLYDKHPPFQIDGNFGATSGVAEMLLQSQGDYIEPLAALPDKWNDGCFKGMKARGNFEISASWVDGHAETFNIKSGRGKECKVRYDGISGYTVADITNAEFITPEEIDENTISFPTVAGAEYIITTKQVTLPEKPKKEETDNKTTDNPNTENDSNPIVSKDGTIVKNTENNNTVITKTEYLLSKPVIKKITALKGGKIILKLREKVVGAKGYRIRCSTKKNMKKARNITLKSASKKKFKVTKLKRKKRYYFQIRAYIADSDGNIVYGNWSAKKKVRTK